MKDAAAGDNVSRHARLSAKDASQMLGLRTGNSGRCFVPAFSNPAAARHLFLSLADVSSLRRRPLAGAIWIVELLRIAASSAGFSELIPKYAMRWMGENILPQKHQGERF
jgi:hypothetical protein